MAWKRKETVNQKKNMPKDKTESNVFLKLAEIQLVVSTFRAHFKKKNVE